MTLFTWVDLTQGFVADPTPINAMGRKVNELSQPIMGYGIRNTNSTSSGGAAQGVIRLDNLPLIGGEVYQIWTSPLLFNTNTAGTAGQCLMYANSAGIATTASTVVCTAGSNSTTGVTGNQKSTMFNFLYIPSSNQTVSFLLAVQRLIGAGTFTLNGVPVTGSPIQLVIERKGNDPGDTGVLI